MTYYKPGGPIFLVIGGEWTMTERSKQGIEDGPRQTYGKLAKWAKELDGAMFYLEHRYYGSSVPMEHVSLESYSWLSSR